MISPERIEETLKIIWANMHNIQAQKEILASLIDDACEEGYEDGFTAGSFITPPYGKEQP